MTMDELFVLVLFVIIFLLIWGMYRLNTRLKEEQDAHARTKGKLSNFTDDPDEDEGSDDAGFEDDEELDEQAKLAFLIKAKCQYAHCHTEILSNSGDFDDETLEYERSRYEKMKLVVMEHLSEIDDEFDRGFAIHHIIELLVSGNDIEEAKVLFSKVDDDFIKEKIIEDFPIFKE